MSKAIQCDRCHKCFSPYNMPDGGNFMTIPEFYTQDTNSITDRKYIDRRTDLNLCVSCTKDFYNFMFMYMFNK